MNWQTLLMRPTWIEIDEAAAAHNVTEIRRLVGPGRKVIACLKANANGHGAVRLAHVFTEHGADMLAVGNLEEAVQLRAHGVIAPVLVFGNSLPDAAHHYLDHGLTPTVYDLETARALSRLASQPHEIYVKIETGLGRLGVAAEQGCDFIKQVLLLPKIRVAGVYTHFGPAAGAADKSFVIWQYERFTRLLQQLEQEGVHIPVQQAANSGALLDLPDTYLTAVCPGKALYSPVATTAPRVQATFRPAFVAIKTRIIQIRNVPGATPGGQQGPTGPSRVAVVPIGQADGYAGRMAKGGSALVRGQRAPVIGAVSLEHTKLDVSAVAGAEVGDEVVLAGKQGGEEISLAEIGQTLDCDPREALGRFAGRLPHVYFRDGMPVWLSWRFGQVDLLRDPPFNRATTRTLEATKHGSHEVGTGSSAAKKEAARGDSRNRGDQGRGLAGKGGGDVAAGMGRERV